jgi:hypothetical protein
MSYMMSKGGHLGDSDRHWQPHLMFHVANTTGASWGANMPGSPVLMIRKGPEPETVFLVPVGDWSDGTTVTADASEVHHIEFLAD